VEGGGSGVFSRFRLVMEGGERNLCRVQELAGALFRNRVDEYAVGRASDEGADVFTTGKRRHSFAESRIRLVRCVDLVKVVPGGILEGCIIGALPGGAATLDGCPGLFGVGVERCKRNGLNQAQFRCGF